MGELTTITGQGLVKPIVKWIAGCGTKRGGGQCAGTPSNQGSGLVTSSSFNFNEKYTKLNLEKNYFINETYFNQLKSRSSW